MAACGQLRSASERERLSRLNLNIMPPDPDLRFNGNLL
jgi:hypothetical protein